MKTRIALVVLFVTSVSILHTAQAQHVEVFIGARQPQFARSTVQLTYIDESPAPDVFTTTTTLANNIYYSVGASVNNYNNTQKMYYDFLADAYFGDLKGFDLGGSVGYPFFLNDSNSISILPAVSGGMAYLRKDLGTLINTTGFIQVNETMFGYGQNVDVALGKFSFFLRPNISLLFDITQKYQLIITGAYMIDLSIDEFIDFSGKDGSGKEVSDSEPVDASNLSYQVDGKPSDNVPFDMNGFEVKIGVGIRL